MRIVVMLGSICLAMAFGVSCSPDDKDRCGENLEYRAGGCFERSVDASSRPSEADQDDAGVDISDSETGVGSACSCTGTDCEVMGEAIPYGGTIVGCDSLPSEYNGAVKVCMRSAQSVVGPPTYFANGFCSFFAADCTGNEQICPMVTIGDYAAMTTCPENTVMMKGSRELGDAKIITKLCAPACANDDQCRAGEFDPVWSENTQYQCAEVDGVKFCTDPRNMLTDLTVERF